MSSSDRLSLGVQPISDQIQTPNSARPKFTRYIGRGIILGVWFVVFGIPISLGAWLLWETGMLTPHPKDAELVALLNDHREDFQKLIGMIEQDVPIRIVHPTWLDPDKGISEARWNEYRTIFGKLGLHAGMQKWSGQTVLFLVSTKGFVGGGSIKGLMYRPDKPEPLYESLDKGATGLPEGIIAYRKIDDDWYITFDYSN